MVSKQIKQSLTMRVKKQAQVNVIRQLSTHLIINLVLIKGKLTTKANLKKLHEDRFRGILNIQGSNFLASFLNLSNLQHFAQSVSYAVDYISTGANKKLAPFDLERLV